MSGSKAEILGRVRAALGRTEGAAAPEPAAVPRDYHPRGAHDPGHPQVLEELVDRLVDYKATVHRCGPDEVAATVAAALRERDVRRVVVPSGLDLSWLSAWDGQALADAPLAPLDLTTLDGADGVLTACAIAVAQTGTIVLDAGPDQGRRAITLVPDYHLVVVRAAQVVETVPEFVRALRPDRPLTMISGPSATSDIELNRVEGVHGPRTLVVVLVSA